jgi:predicted AlkP superfamily pyrophosphatase or phosphodiesterase
MLLLTQNGKDRVHYFCMMRKQLLFTFCIFYSGLINAQPDTIQHVVAGRRNSPEQQQKPYVIMISADGFRYDYAKKYGAKKLLALSQQGVQADAMIPSYPSLTFPNHYTLATGLYPSHHGLVDNYFYAPGRKQFYSMKKAETVRDGTWYGGTPLWVLAEQQHMLSASFFWIGSEADIKGIYPSYYYHYVDSFTVERRIQIVVNWLKLPPERRPHFITLYFSRVDHDGHDFGPDAPETGEAVRWIDTCMQKLTDAVRTTGLPVNFIFTADHGMTKIDTKNPLPIPSAVDSNLFYIPRGVQLVELYAKNKKDIMPTYSKLKKQEKNFTVYLRSTMPAHLHYGEKDDVMNRIGDILLIPKWPQVFHSGTSKLDPGAHGFDPVLVKDMLTVFYAWGPAFKKGLRIPAFKNVDVYPVVTKILGLHYTDKIDGSPQLAERIVK